MSEIKGNRSHDALILTLAASRREAKKAIEASVALLTCNTWLTWATPTSKASAYAAVAIQSSIRITVTNYTEQRESIDYPIKKNTGMTSGVILGFERGGGGGAPVQVHPNRKHHCDKP